MPPLAKTRPDGAHQPAPFDFTQGVVSNVEPRSASGLRCRLQRTRFTLVRCDLRRRRSRLEYVLDEIRDDAP